MMEIMNDSGGNNVPKNCYLESKEIINKEEYNISKQASAYIDDLNNTNSNDPSKTSWFDQSLASSYGMFSTLETSQQLDEASKKCPKKRLVLIKFLHKLSCLSVLKSFGSVSFHRFSAIFLIIMLSFPSFTFGQAFVHPGVLHTQADFDRMAQKVAANASPWIDDYNMLLSSNLVSLSYQPTPVPWVNRGAQTCTPDNSKNLFNDAAAAYQMALIWKITGNTSYADVVVKIMNAWSSTLTQLGCPYGPGWDSVLMAGTQGYQFAAAGEIMRNYSGLSAANFTAFQNMMMNPFYNVTGVQMTGQGMGQYANWVLSQVAAVMAIGVLCDNQTMFQSAITWYKTGSNNGAIDKAIYFIHPGYLGQGQEAGRDQGHDTLNAGHLSAITQIAWNQGVDLYAYGNNRVLAFAEYTAKGNLKQPGTQNYYDMPFAIYKNYNWPLNIYDTEFAGVQGHLRPVWACFYHHYVNVKGLAAPFTGLMMNQLTPDWAAGPRWANSGAFDQLGLQTLTCTIDPISRGVAPQVRGYVVAGSVQLNWWGSAYTTSYNVKRGNAAGGPYTKIANVNNMTFTYTDSGLPAGTYYYVITVVNSTGSEILTSNEAKVLADIRQLQTYFTFDGSIGNLTNGTIIVDSSGSGNNAVLSGNASLIPGVRGQALQLDGATSYLNLTLSTINLSDFTIATWININSQRVNARLFDFGYGTGRYMYFAPQIWNGYASYAITFNTGNGEQGVTTPFTLPTGQWIHIAVTYYGTTLSVYVNGIFVAGGQVPLPPYQLREASDNPASITIGKSQYPTHPLLYAAIDEFKIYYFALTSDQVYSLAQNITTWLKFDSLGSVTPDSSPNANNGTVIGGISQISGFVGNAASCNGNNGYISLPTGIVSKINNFTIAAWVYLNAAQTWARIFDFGSGTSTYMFFTPRNGNGVARFCMLLGSTSTNIDAPSPLPTGRWTHAAVTLSGNVVSIYINGSLVAWGNASITPSQLGSTTRNWIGRSQYPADPYLNGIVDDFRIYQQALTTDQILAIALQPNFILPFDETSGNNTADISGNNNNGTIIGNGAFVPGVYNNAIKLDGVSSYVNLPAGIISNASDFTISSWVNLNNTGNWTRLFDFGFGTGKWMYFVPSTNTAVASFSIYNGNNQSTLSGTAPLPSNRWVHVAVTRQGTNGTLYINGQVVTSWFVFISPNSLNASGLTAQNCIGHSQFSTDPYLHGIVDDFRFYYYALDQSQIAVLAQQLDIYLAFDESSGNTSADSSGNGNTASLIGNVTFIPGKTNNAIKLDGSSGYVNLSANILNGLADFTVATWVYLNSAQTWARVFDFGFGTSQYMHFAPKNNKGLAEFAIVLGTTSQYMFGTTVPVNQWVHVAITRFGTLGTYYLNGQAVATSTITLSPLQLLTNTTNLTSQIWIGKSQFAAANGDPYLNGIIDDFRVYRGALAADQVASLAQSLNLLYKFDETTNSTTTTADSSGNGDNASLIGNVTFVPGVNNNAISLSGNASYISLTNNQTIASLSDFTVSTWVYLNSLARYARIFDFGFGTNGWVMLTVWGSKTIEYSIKDYGGTYTVAASQTLPVGVWMHVAVTQQGNNVSIYLNGTLSATDTLWKLPVQIYRSDVPAQNFIGHSQYSADPYLNGSIDDFRLYQGALSPAQIVALSQFLVLDLPFAESNGIVTADATGNGNIGQLIGGASFAAGRYPSDNPSNNAVQLDGSSGYINLPTGIVSQLSDFTIVAFVYLNSAQTSARVFDFGSGTSNYMYFTPRNANGVAQYCVLLNGTTYSLNASAAVPVGSWIHVAVTQRFNVVTLYIDGNLMASLNIPATPAQLGATTQNWIGRSQYSADPYLNGIVDEFTIYYRTLAPNEILSLAQPFVFYYAFNQTSGTIVYDSSVNGYNGTLIGNATLVPGLTGNAVQLNGINSYVQINATNILQNVNDFTVATWVYLNSLVTWHRIFDFGFGTAQWMMFTPCGSGCATQFSIKLPNGTQYTVSASSLPTGQWVHVAVTLAGNVGTIYVNGTASAWGTIPITPAQIYNSTLTASNYIGHSQYSGDPYLNGTVDDFRFYQGALSAAQIATLAA